MAKKRKRTHSRRRHRVGALNMKAGSPLIKFGSIAAGFLLGNQLNQSLIDKMVGTPTDPVKTGKTIAIAQVGIGSALLFLKLGKKPKGLIEEVLGGILLGSGLKRASVVFKSGATTMSGYGDVPVIGAYKAPGQIGMSKKVAGYGDVPVIGSYTTPGALNGSKVMGNVDSGCTNCGDKSTTSGSGLLG